MEKSAGQIAYEADVAIEPTYADGGMRRSWADLSKVAKWSWDLNPTVRARSKAGASQ